MVGHVHSFIMYINMLYRLVPFNTGRFKISEAGNLDGQPRGYRMFYIIISA